MSWNYRLVIDECRNALLLGLVYFGVFAWDVVVILPFVIESLLFLRGRRMGYLSAWLLLLINISCNQFIKILIQKEIRTHNLWYLFLFLCYQFIFAIPTVLDQSWWWWKYYWCQVQNFRLWISNCFQFTSYRVGQRKIGMYYNVTVEYSWWLVWRHRDLWLDVISIRWCDWSV